MRDLETTGASKFEAPRRPIASTPDACWHLSFAELMAQLRRLGARALARHHTPKLVRMPAAKMRQVQRTNKGLGADEIKLLRLQESMHEFAAFTLPNSRGQTLIECALHEVDALPANVGAYLPALGASTWELYEVLQPAAAATHMTRLRRLDDDAVVKVQALELDETPRRGDIAGWRVFDAGDFLAAPRALPVPRDEVAAIMSQLTLEASGWGGAKASRAAYMRARGNLLMLNHCIRSARHRFCEKVEPPNFPQPDALVSPSESSLPEDYWRRLGQAFSVLEISAAGRPGVLFPHSFQVDGGRILCVEQAADSWVATLFESADAHSQWAAVQQTLAPPTHSHGTEDESSRSPRAIPQLRSWRARPAELADADVAFLRRLRLKPLQDGAALGVRLDADWSWQDLDLSSADQLIEALHTASRKLRTGEGLAA